MTLQLTLPPDLEERLRREAERQQLSPDAFTVKLLEAHLPPMDRKTALLAMLQQWQAEDEGMSEEERVANTDLLRAIDEDRLSDRKLFNDILKDEPQ